MAPGIICCTEAVHAMIPLPVVIVLVLEALFAVTAALDYLGVIGGEE